MMWFLTAANVALVLLSCVLYVLNRNPGNILTAAVCLLCGLFTGYFAWSDRRRI